MKEEQEIPKQFSIMGTQPWENESRILSAEEEVELQKYLTYLKTVKDEKIPKELTLEEIESIVNVYPNKPDSCYKFGAQWAKERLDTYWKHQLSERDKEWERRMVEEVGEAWTMAQAVIGRMSKKEYILKLKEKYNIKD